MSKILLTIAVSVLAVIAGWSYRDRQRIDALEVAVASIKTDADVSQRRPTVVSTVGLPRSVSLANSPLLGEAKASIALVVYSDFQCPYCASFAKATLPQIVERYVRTAELVVAFKHFPIESLHARAFPLAEAATCAHLQGAFWPFHDALLSDRSNWSETGVQSLAAKLSLDESSFQQCIGASTTRNIVGAQVVEARQAGMTGTPAFLLGTVSDNSVAVISRIAGSQPFEVFAREIDRVLKMKN